MPVGGSWKICAGKLWESGLGFSSEFPSRASQGSLWHPAKGSGSGGLRQRGNMLTLPTLEKGEATVRRINPGRGHSAVTSTVCDNVRLYITITTDSKMTVKKSFLWRHMGSIHSLRVPLASIPLPAPSPCCRYMEPIVTRSIEVCVWGESCC